MAGANLKRWYLILLLSLALLSAGGCAGGYNCRPDAGIESQSAQALAEEPAKKTIVSPLDAYDPWESFNREMYRFNYYFDRYLFLPAVSVYEWVLPDYIEERISGIFSNLGEFNNLLNHLLQLKGRRAVMNVGRFALNTTVGLVGMYDPATRLGMPEREGDFGQTLGVYGVGAGPYLVLPVLGPSSLRDTTGLAFDMSIRIVVWNWVFKEFFDNVSSRNEWRIRTSADLIEAIDARHNIDFRYYQSGSPFEYELIRMLYLEKRRIDLVK